MGNETPPVDPRVLLAAERTLLAWVRTGLALMGFGFVVARFTLFLHELRGAGPPHGHRFAEGIGVGLVILGVLVLAGAGRRYQRYVAALNAGRDHPVPGASFGLLITLLLIAVGIALALYLLSPSFGFGDVGSHAS